MEYQFKSQKPGLTQFKCFQIIESSEDPYDVWSLDYFLTRSIEGRLTGVGLGSETKLMSAMHPLLAQGKRLRYFGIFVEGGDVNVRPKDIQDIASRKVLALDTNCSRAIRTFAAAILGIPNEREPFAAALAQNPSYLNTLWENETFAHINAFLWNSNIFLRHGKGLSHIRLVTIRSCELIREVYCISSPSSEPRAVMFHPFTTEDFATFDTSFYAATRSS